MASTTGRVAMITGISGQDGAYLARLLLGKGYKVVGCARRTSNKVLPRLDELGITGDVELVDFDLFEYTKDSLQDNSYDLSLLRGTMA